MKKNLKDFLQVCYVNILLKTQPEQNCFGNITHFLTVKAAMRGSVKLIFTKLINFVQYPPCRASLNKVYKLDEFELN